MHYIVTETTNPFAPRQLGTFEAVAAALREINAIDATAYVAEDPDTPDHYDLITKTGRIFTIEPTAAH